MVEYVSLHADASAAARLPAAAEESFNGASTSNVQLESAAAAVAAASPDRSHTDAFGNLTVGAQSTSAVAAAIEATKALLRKIEVKGAGNLAGGRLHQAQSAGSSLDMLEVWCCALDLASAARFRPLFDRLAVCSPPTPCYRMGQSIPRQLAAHLRFSAAPKQQVVRNWQHAGSGCRAECCQAACKRRGNA